MKNIKEGFVIRAVAKFSPSGAEKYLCRRWRLLFEIMPFSTGDNFSGSSASPSTILWAGVALDTAQCWLWSQQSHTWGQELPQMWLQNWWLQLACYFCKGLTYLPAWVMVIFYISACAINTRGVEKENFILTWKQRQALKTQCISISCNYKYKFID